MRRLALACALGALAAPLDAQQLDTVAIREWTVPWANTRPRDPAVGADHRVWFVGQTGNYVGVLDPRTGEFGKFDLPAGAGPHNVVIGPDGTLWYAGNRDSHVGRMNPATGEVTKIPMPDAAARDPHTLVFAPDGTLWFTVQGGNYIGRVAKSGEVSLARVATERSRPYGIVVAEDGTPWVALFGTNAIASIDPATMALREYRLPAVEARPRRLEIGTDGGVWYVDYARGTLARLDPATGAVREWVTPGGAGSRPYALATDDRGRMWFVETGGEPNRFVGFDPSAERFISSTAVPSGGGTVRHMVYYEPAREIWFGTDTNTIGVARIP